MAATLIRLLLLTLLWAALQGSFSVGNVLLGAVLAAAVLRLSRPVFAADESPAEVPFAGRPRPFRRAWRVLVLVLVFARELVESAVEVARYTLQPTLQIRPGIVAYPLDVETDREITTLANLISLTPGTLSLDVDPGRTHLYVHSISVETEDGREVIDGIKTTLEKHVSRALGPVGRSGAESTSEPSGEEPTAEGGAGEPVGEG